VVLVHSFGQGRSPFMLNDIRNRRGILSLSFSLFSGVRDVRWDIHGVAVSGLHDPFNTAGLPLESDLVDSAPSNGGDWGWRSVDRLVIPGHGGISWFRTRFGLPVAQEAVRLPLRVALRATDAISAFIWVNGLLIGTFISYVGPQSDFYIPEGLLRDKADSENLNHLVVACYGGNANSIVQIKVLPWVVDRASGNLCEEKKGGEAFLLARHRFPVL